MAFTSDTLFAEITTRTQEMLTAEIYARVSHIPMLSHYTNVEAFGSMLRSRELWFSSVRDMNDTSEAIEGFQLACKALEHHGHLIFENYGKLDVDQQFRARQSLLETDTHVLSLCEHGSDRQTDRLPMWQAYGKDGNGICLVLSKNTLLGQSARNRGFPVNWCPVEYDDEAQFSERVRSRLLLIKQAIAGTPGAEMHIPLPTLGMLIAASTVPLVLGHKNLGFEHEKEVRFIRSRLVQSLVPPEGAGYRIVTTGNVPRTKFILPLRKYPEFDVDASLPALLDHIIIGPSDAQQEMTRVVRSLLDQNDLGHVRIVQSSIPYRPSK